MKPTYLPTVDTPFLSCHKRSVGLDLPKEMEGRSITIRGGQ